MMLSTILLLALLGAPTCPGPACAPSPHALAAAPPAPRPPARRGPAQIQAAHALLLWIEGDALVASASAPAAPLDAAGERAWMGDTLTPDTRLSVADGGLVILLLDGDRLARLEGPASHVWTDAGLARQHGPRATVARLEGYGESPLAPSPPLRFFPPPAAADADVGLSLTAPPSTLLLAPEPVIRWRWSGADARFDLTFARLDGDGHATVVERWRGLAGRSLRLWAPLEPGTRYRATVTLRGARPLSRILADQVEFGVIDEVARREVDEALAALRANRRASDPPRPELDVLRARLLERHGLLADAERVWVALSLLYPTRLEPRHHARRLRAELHRERAQ